MVLNILGPHSFRKRSGEEGQKSVAWVTDPSISNSSPSKMKITLYEGFQFSKLESCSLISNFFKVGDRMLKNVLSYVRETSCFAKISVSRNTMVKSKVRM